MICILFSPACRRGLGGRRARGRGRGSRALAPRGRPAGLGLFLFPPSRSPLHFPLVLRSRFPLPPTPSLWRLSGWGPSPSEKGRRNLFNWSSRAWSDNRKEARKKKKKNPGGQRPGRKALLLLAGSALGVRAWPPAPTPAPGGLTLLLLFPAYVSSPFPSWPTSCASVNPLHVPACMNTSLKKKQNPVLSFEPRCLKPLSPPPAPIPSSLQSPEKGHFPGRPHRKALRYVLLSRFCFDRVAGVLPASVSLHLQ